MSSGDRQRIGVHVCLLALLVGCSAPRPERGEVQREWNQTLRELGIQPVYPPREDLAVGDVYVRRGRVDDPTLVPGAGFAPIDLWLASAASGSALDGFYGGRTSYPLAPGAGAQPGPGGPIHQVGDNTRLRVVAFPEFSSLDIRSADARAFVPVEALGLGLGGIWEGEHQVTVKVPVAESCGLPLARALSLVAERNGATWKLKRDVADVFVLVKLHDDVKAWAATAPGLDDEQRARLRADPSLHLDLVTEVFYARAIDVAVSSRTSGGARATARPLGTAGVAAATPADEGDAVARARRLNAELQESDGLDVPGGALQFLAASDRGLAMRRTFERPVAIGYRAVQLTVDPATAEVIGFGAASERVAQVTSGQGLELARALQAEIAALMAAEERSAFQVEVADVSALAFRLRRIRDGVEPPQDLEARARDRAPEIAARVRGTRTWDAGAVERLAAFARGAFTVALASDEE